MAQATARTRRAADEEHPEESVPGSEGESTVRKPARPTGAKRKSTKKAGAAATNRSSTGKKKATPKGRGGGKKQGRHK